MGRKHVPLCMGVGFALVQTFLAWAITGSYREWWVVAGYAPLGFVTGYFGARLGMWFFDPDRRRELR